EVRRLPGRDDMTGALVLAVDRFLRDQRFEPVDRVARDVEQLAGAAFAVAPDEHGRIDSEAGQYLAAVARARAERDVLALERDHHRADTREVPRGGEPGVAGADNGDVDRALSSKF